MINKESKREGEGDEEWKKKRKKERMKEVLIPGTHNDEMKIKWKLIQNGKSFCDQVENGYYFDSSSFGIGENVL